jgi:hypothetical protein
MIVVHVTVQARILSLWRCLPKDTHVYKINVCPTGKYYIGAMSHTLRNCVGGGHLQDTRRLLRDGIHGSTLASHLAHVWRQNSNSIPMAGMMRDALSCSILWQGDPFSNCSKFFGVNFLAVNCVRRSGLCCSSIHGWMGRT